MLEVEAEEAALSVVAREAERGLRQVVRPEREEVGVVREVAGAKRGARQLDHRAAAELEAAFLGRGPRR